MTTPTPATEHDAIAKTVQRYVDAGRSGSSADMKAAFHADATIFGYVGPDLFAGHIQKLYDWIDENGPAAELQSRIAGIDSEETIATVRLELENWSGHRFTDMFTLLKLDGEWKIISKVFYLHPQTPVFRLLEVAPETAKSLAARLTERFARNQH